jgi:dolichyl-phosphate beta-glucosyltransferase
LEEAELFMSVVVPAFNEEARLVEMMEEAVSFLKDEYGLVQEKKRGLSMQNGTAHGSNGQAGHTNESAAPVKGTTKSTGWEIVIVSDGSTDKTVETALKFARDNELYKGPNEECVRVVSLNKNRGKGGAVVHGMKHVRGQYVVFADADGASKFQDLRKLVSACQNIEDTTARGIAVGSRAHLVGSAAVVQVCLVLELAIARNDYLTVSQRSFLRNFLMHSFHLLLRILTPPATAKIRDTQCGFKLFSRPTLPYIIPHMHSEGWIFDVEMLMLAEYTRIPVAEVPVGWREVKGSKLNVVWDSLGMAWSLAVLRAAWGFGVYRRS